MEEHVHQILSQNNYHTRTPANKTPQQQPCSFAPCACTRPANKTPRQLSIRAQARLQSAEDFDRFKLFIQEKFSRNDAETKTNKTTIHSQKVGPILLKIPTNFSLKVPYVHIFIQQHLEVEDHQKKITSFHFQYLFLGQLLFFCKVQIIYNLQSSRS